MLNLHNYVNFVLVFEKYNCLVIKQNIKYYQYFFPKAQCMKTEVNPFSVQGTKQ